MSGRFDGMKTSIDRAGRLVIPKALRDQVGMSAGEVEITIEGSGLRISSTTTDRLVERDGFLLLPSAGGEMDDQDVRELRLADQK